MKEVLDAFCLASGLKINMDKSRFLTSKNISRKGNKICFYY